jgi:hypothetical protein
VLPEIEGKGASYAGWLQRWWQFWRIRDDLYGAIEGMSRVLVIARISKTVQPVLIENNAVFNEKTVVFAYDDYSHFGLLSSALHYWWVVSKSSTLGEGINYAPTDCFDTFAQPDMTARLGEAGAALDAGRRELMLDRWEGLTATYNRVHNPREEATDIAEIRRLHIELDHAVAAGYGWSDLALDHDFYATRQGTRFTISPEARVELLDRLLELNHGRHAEEVRIGLQPGKKKRASALRVSRRSRSSAPFLFEIEP